MDRAIELVKKAQAGDESATQMLIEENMGLIWSVVKRFTGRGYDQEDLFQIGSMGLLKCIQKFDTSYDVKFSTYAVPMIMGEIKRFLRDDGMIKISRPLKEMAVKARYMQDELTKKSGRSPTISELAAALEVEREELVMALDASREVESLYATVYQGDSTPVYLIDKLDVSEDKSNETIDIIALKEVVGKLAPRDRQIIILRYFEEKTQSEIAKELGVSQVQISRIEKKIIQKIRESLQWGKEP
ncbi:RNA polymerase sporulation sigma factor SigF [Anaeropeptidivorans aminofermentans]|jgi:RNA polymerase sporulation-specific sigma factor|uniref:RNA polymerase sporulation sigma factor SigF n=1 Tax=Anaeropeptidivorans aminofermentans TaxID=2934315 RepID=UPI0020245E64|nr:RNA polymerase sporulation sigma factor SigF [Anaeropeptidivorans aminofermentans]MBE6012502.1 RNA polymerase sporulation sigma factor SigF [Lachnospiraceae bacterium]